MGIDFTYPEYEIVRDQNRCITCRACERQCANLVHSYDSEKGVMLSDESKCVNCHRCVSICPTRALKIVKTDHDFKENANWPKETIYELYRQAGSGGMLLSSMGNPKPYPIYWDKILINASQVTNPSIDPLREPMETRTYLGQKPVKIERDKNGNIINNLTPQLKLNVPIMFSAMSYGSISYNAHESLARAAEELGTFYNTGEGGLHEDFTSGAPIRSSRSHPAVSAYTRNTSGRARPWRSRSVRRKTRHRRAPARREDRQRHLQDADDPEGSDAISPAPHHDIYSIEDLRQLVFSLKEATDYKKPVIVKIAAVHNVSAIASALRAAARTSSP
jgi:glutamate synthase domain-containing protein 2